LLRAGGGGPAIRAILDYHAALANIGIEGEKNLVALGSKDGAAPAIKAILDCHKVLTAIGFTIKNLFDFANKGGAAQVIRALSELHKKLFALKFKAKHLKLEVKHLVAICNTKGSNPFLRLMVRRADAIEASGLTPDDMVWFSQGNGGAAGRLTEKLGLPANVGVQAPKNKTASKEELATIGITRKGVDAITKGGGAPAINAIPETNIGAQQRVRERPEPVEENSCQTEAKITDLLNEAIRILRGDGTSQNHSMRLANGMLAYLSSGKVPTPPVSKQAGTATIRSTSTAVAYGRFFNQGPHLSFPSYPAENFEEQPGQLRETDDVDNMSVVDTNQYLQHDIHFQDLSGKLKQEAEHISGAICGVVTFVHAEDIFQLSHQSHRITFYATKDTVWYIDGQLIQNGWSGSDSYRSAVFNDITTADYHFSDSTTAYGFNDDSSFAHISDNPHFDTRVFFMLKEAQPRLPEIPTPASGKRRRIAEIFDESDDEQSESTSDYNISR